jgi:hypothetical protein
MSRSHRAASGPRGTRLDRWSAARYVPRADVVLPIRTDVLARRHAEATESLDQRRARIARTAARERALAALPPHIVDDPGCPGCAYDRRSARAQIDPASLSAAELVAAARAAS